jgi:hypothetical protein
MRTGAGEQPVRVELVPTAAPLLLLASARGPRTDAWLNAADVAFLADARLPAGGPGDGGAAWARRRHFKCNVPVAVVLRLWKSGRGRSASGMPLLAPDGALILPLGGLVRPLLASTGLHGHPLQNAFFPTYGLDPARVGPVINHTLEPILPHDRYFPLNVTGPIHDLASLGIDMRSHPARSVSTFATLTEARTGLLRLRKEVSDFGTVMSERIQSIIATLRGTGEEPVALQVAGDAGTRRALLAESTQRVQQTAGMKEETFNEGVHYGRLEADTAAAARHGFWGAALISSHALSVWLQPGPGQADAGAGKVAAALSLVARAGLVSLSQVAVAEAARMAGNFVVGGADGVTGTVTYQPHSYTLVHNQNETVAQCVEQVILGFREVVARPGVVAVDSTTPHCLPAERFREMRNRLIQGVAGMLRHAK